MKKKCALVFPAIRLLLFLSSLFISHLAAAGPTYSVTDLGQVNPTAINDAGQVTGYTGYNGDAHAFLYSNGAISDLGTLGGNISYGFGINSFGNVVGNSQLPPSVGGLHAFIYDANGMHDLGTLGSDISEAIGINDAGQIAGSSYTQEGVDHAFLYTNSSLNDLGTLEGDTFSLAQAINHSGQVVGFSYSPGGARERAFVYSGGVMNNISMGTYSRAMDINDSGNIVGFWDESPLYTGSHAFFYSNGAITDLGTLGGQSQARGINNANQIVGFSVDPIKGIRAVLYKGGATQDLNILIAEDSGWVLIEAFAINNVGQIIGTGTHNGEQRAFLLTPSTPPLPQENVAVVLVHGIFGSPYSFGHPQFVTCNGNRAYLQPGCEPALEQLLETEGLRVESFDYSDKTSEFGIRGRTWTIEQLAGELAKYICEQVKGGTLRFDDGSCSVAGSVDIVAHSMGGLLTRAYVAGMAIDRASRSPIVYKTGTIGKLVMAGTPNYGAPLANRSDIFLGRKPLGYQQIKEVEFGSGFLWDLSEKWQLSNLPSADMLAIAGTRDFTSESGDDGVVPVASATLPSNFLGSNVRYCPYVHKKNIVYIQDPSHLTYQFLRPFLLGSPVPDQREKTQPQYPPDAVINRGLLLLRLADSRTKLPVAPGNLVKAAQIGGGVRVDGNVVRAFFNEDKRAGTITIWPIKKGKHVISFDVAPSRRYALPDAITVDIEGARGRHPRLYG